MGLPSNFVCVYTCSIVTCDSHHEVRHIINYLEVITSVKRKYIWDG